MTAKKNNEGGVNEFRCFRNLRELLSGLIPAQIQHKFLQTRKQMEYDNNEH